MWEVSRWPSVFRGWIIKGHAAPARFLGILILEPGDTSNPETTMLEGPHAGAWGRQSQLRPFFSQPIPDT